MGYRKNLAEGPNFIHGSFSFPDQLDIEFPFVEVQDNTSRGFVMVLELERITIAPTYITHWSSQFLKLVEPCTYACNQPDIMPPLDGVANNLISIYDNGPVVINILYWVY